MRDEYSDKVARHFAEDWQAYDRQIRQVIPHYDQALATLVDVLVWTCPQPRRILDLGVGTGNLADLLLCKFPEAQFTGVDIVSDFVHTAEQRLRSYGDRTSLLCGDVADLDFPSRCDLVVSSFMFHHLEDPLKRTLFQRIHDALVPEGCFVNLDFVDSGSPFYSRAFDELRINAMKSQGVSEKQIAMHYVEHRQLELPVPLNKQLKWLEEAGFADTECFWKYLNLAMFGGRKRSS